MEKQQRTYQSRLSVMPGEGDTLLSAYASLFGKAEKTLFVKLQAGGNIANLKREFIKRFGIAARQFNSIASGLKGNVSSIKERRTGLIREAEARITKAKKALRKSTDPVKLHQKKRRIMTLQTRLNKLKSDHASNTVRLCFGGRRLFRSQFFLEKNGYASHDEWLKDWQTSRNSQFFVIGSKDEFTGCQSCVAAVDQDGGITLRLRLPDALTAHDKYLNLSGIRFEHGHEAIVAAIGRNLSDNKTDRQAINYRFLQDDTGWRVFVTVVLPESQVRSHKDVGVVGIDINADHLAVTETDRYGNPVEYFSVSCVIYGKTSEQRKAIIGDAVKQIMVFAIDRRKPIVIEKLDFQKKKSALGKQGAKYSRMLSALAYTQIQAIIRARTFDAGIEVHEVNPAYTSVIGQYKFTDRYGMSKHNAAALVIGRRVLGFSESLPSQLYVTLPLPVRNRGRHVWSKWAVVSRKASAAHAAHRRSGLPRSSPSPVFDKARLVTIPPVAGEIPACESSLILFE